MCKPNKNGGEAVATISVPDLGDVEVTHDIKKNKKAIKSLALGTDLLSDIFYCLFYCPT